MVSICFLLIIVIILQARQRCLQSASTIVKSTVRKGEPFQTPTPLRASLSLRDFMKRPSGTFRVF